jgi:hypothetical protein
MRVGKNGLWPKSKEGRRILACGPELRQREFSLLFFSLFLFFYSKAIFKSIFKIV